MHLNSFIDIDNIKRSFVDLRYYPGRTLGPFRLLIYV